MFERTAIRLLEGGFVCESTMPECFRWLRLQEAQDEMSEFLGKIGRRLAVTPRGMAFYAVWKTIGNDERAEVRRVFASVKQSIRPMVHFLTLCMDAGSKNASPAPGDTVEYPALLKAITDNAHLLEVLRGFGLMGKDFAVTDSSAKGMLDKVVAQMEKAGYLAIFNEEQMTYRFTGKLDYFHQVVDFLLDHEGVATAEQQKEDESQQGDLV